MVGHQALGDTEEEPPLLALLGLRSRPTPLGEQFAEAWEKLMAKALARLTRHGDLEKHLAAISELKAGTPQDVRLDEATPTTRVARLRQVELERGLQALAPWKKGPFLFETGDGDLTLDAEWRSDRKWARLSELGISFRGQHVLDVGTGNGYFLLRLLGAGARSALGVEPGLLSICQYLLIRQLFAAERSALVPVTCTEFLQNCSSYDTVMSMGVLYHRRSPLDHLVELRGFLRPGGRLILETLVAPGPLGYALLPEGRYAQMRNVFFIPSPDTLASWLCKIGFTCVERSEIACTSVSEQRSTPFMTHPSLHHFLAPGSVDPDDPKRATVEGHIRPHRMIFTARAPEQR